MQINVCFFDQHKSNSSDLHVHVNVFVWVCLSYFKMMSHIYSFRLIPNAVVSTAGVYMSFCVYLIFFSCVSPQVYLYI